MKYIGIVILFYTINLGLNGQPDLINSELKFYDSKLNFNEDQKDKVLLILKRKNQELESISSSRSLDENRFRKKRRNVYAGVDQSIRLILERSQLEAWSEYKREQRRINAQKINELKAINASKEDILDAQYGISN